MENETMDELSDFDDDFSLDPFGMLDISDASERFEDSSANLRSQQTLK